MLTFDIFILASVVGTTAFALSGFIQGVTKSLDIMGVFILSFITANGGGIMRDVLIGRTPLALQEPSSAIIVLCTFVFGYVLIKRKLFDVEKRTLFVISDSIGLVAFSLTGALAGIDAGFGLFGVCVLSFITAAGGGILRDIFVNEVPSVFKSDFYGSIAVLIAITLYILHAFEIDTQSVIAIVFFGALALRLLAYRLKWSLPSFKI